MIKRDSLNIRGVAFYLYAAIDIVYWFAQLRNCRNHFFQNLVDIFELTTWFEKVEVVILIHAMALFIYLMVRLFVCVCDIPRKVSMLLYGFAFVIFSSIFIMAFVSMMNIIVILKTYVMTECLICTVTLCNYAIEVYCENK